MSRVAKRFFLLYGLALAFALVGLHQSSEPLRADCSALDYSGNSRDCSYSEELVDCLRTAVTAYDQCASGGGYIRNVLCTGAYIVDFWACFPLEAAELALG